LRGVGRTQSQYMTTQLDLPLYVQSRRSRSLLTCVFEDLELPCSLCTTQWSQNNITITRTTSMEPSHSLLQWYQG